jgi:hypothetical protein
MPHDTGSDVISDDLDDGFLGFEDNDDFIGDMYYRNPVPGTPEWRKRKQEGEIAKSSGDPRYIFDENGFVAGKTMQYIKEFDGDGVATNYGSNVSGRMSNAAPEQMPIEASAGTDPRFPEGLWNDDNRETSKAILNSFTKINKQSSADTYERVSEEYGISPREVQRHVNELGRSRNERLPWVITPEQAGVENPEERRVRKISGRMSDDVSHAEILESLVSDDPELWEYIQGKLGRFIPDDFEDTVQDPEESREDYRIRMEKLGLLGMQDLTTMGLRDGKQFFKLADMPEGEDKKKVFGKVHIKLCKHIILTAFHSQQ